MAAFFAPASREFSQSIRKTITLFSWTPNLSSSHSLNDPLRISTHALAVTYVGRLC